MNPRFWKDKRVLLTGHTGFKGAWLALWLQRLGAIVTGYALAPPSSPSLFELADVRSGMQSLSGDVRDAAALAEAVSSAAPAIVIHMAAQSLVRVSYDAPVDTYAVNVMGTAHMLEAVRQTAGVKAVVVVTTDKCYENREWAWGYRENEAMGGYDPYSSSKGCAELVSAAYRSSYFNSDAYAAHGVAVATARSGNVIGGGDWAQDRLVPDILAGFAGGKVVQIRHPNAIRPWQHVLEPLCGYLTLAERLYTQGPAYAEAWNFGPNDADARPVSWVADELAKAWGGGAGWRPVEGVNPHEAHHLKLDISKARSRLDWHPQLSLPRALALVVEWAKGWQGGADARTLTLEQIAAYQSQAQN